jgi:predicted SAM-dependent methyltransferase
MKRFIKKLLRVVHLEALPSKLLLRGYRRKLRKKHLPAYSMRVMQEYNQPVRKLHIGCGDHILPTWLNSDFEPDHPGVMQLDATRAFPFEDGDFSYVFSEHMIEHISYADGLNMLAECYRILRPGGKIRISTPDLSFLMDLYKEPKTTLQREYITWSAERYFRKRSASLDTFIINNFFHQWGHQFIYDEKVLRLSLQHAGFSRIVRCNLLHSEDAELRNLENESRLPAGFVRLETLTLEGNKGPV